MLDDCLSLSDPFRNFERKTSGEGTMTVPYNCLWYSLLNLKWTFMMNLRINCFIADTIIRVSVPYSSSSLKIKTNSQ